ncbi:MAG: beta-ketoacyl-ACP synthase 3 [Vulcanimicrobiaceae bacterium]
MTTLPTVSAPVRLGAIGLYAPERIMTNAELQHIVETSDEWIVQRTGIRERRVVAPDEYASHLAIAAIEDLRKAYPEVDLREVDYVIVASTTPDYVYPSVAAQLQDHFKIPNTGAIDISAACAGFGYALNLAGGLIATAQASRVLIVAAETLSRRADYTDRATCVLFGDGAAAALVTRSDTPMLFGMSASSDGSAGVALYRTATRPDINGTVDPSGLLRQDGRYVYRWVMENVPAAVERVLERAQLSLDDIDWFVPHSANLRMIEALCGRIGFPMERTLTSIEDYGNTSAVSIPLALFPAIRNGRVKPGDRILLMGFGGGLVSAGSVLIWG